MFQAFPGRPKKNPRSFIKQARDRHEELRVLVERGKALSVAARKVADSRDLTVHVFARRWIDETLFYRSPAYVAQIVRWLDGLVADTPVAAERIRVIVQQFYKHAIRACW
ncbi:MAG: hypothetical protein H7Z19_15085 [Chitinophagaceae bacterium]|nr:hypothetical protein [Rubrivivax sp.]